MSEPVSILRDLAAVVQQRFDHRPAASYTTELFEGGHAVMAGKVIEEAYELVAAAGEDPPQGTEIIHEAADLVYHLLVLTTAAGVEWRDVERELQSRFGTSGMTEKARRTEKPTE